MLWDDQKRRNLSRSDGKKWQRVEDEESEDCIEATLKGSEKKSKAKEHETSVNSVASWSSTKKGEILRQNE